MKKTEPELKLERALERASKRDDCKYRLYFNKSVEKLGKKAVDYIIAEIVKCNNIDTQDLYITYRKKEYILEVTVYEEDEEGYTDFGVSAMSLLSYIYQYGNYENEEEFRQEQEDKIINWESFCNKYFY